MKIGPLARSSAMLLVTAIACLCEDVPKKDRAPMPEWAFCVAYQLREPDQRDARPIDPNAEKDPFNDGDSWIPRNILDDRNVVDVAALTTRIVKSGVLQQEKAEGVIRGSTQGDQLHPIIESTNPRHAFVFYSYEGKPVVAIEVDFQFNRVRMRPEVRLNEGRLGPCETADLASLARIAVEAGLDLNPFAASLEVYEDRLKKRQERLMKSLEEMRMKDERATKDAEQSGAGRPGAGPDSKPESGD